MDSMCYIAIHKPCGKVVMKTMDTERNRKQAAKEVAACIREGDTVQHVTVDQANALEWCKCFDAQPQPEPTAA